MLGQLDVRDGHRAFEAGEGTGSNAALLATLAGPSGHVSTNAPRLSTPVILFTGLLSGVLDGPETRIDSGTTVGPVEPLDSIQAEHHHLPALSAPDGRRAGHQARALRNDSRVLTGTRSVNRHPRFRRLRAH
jgi:hypothetical protein